MLTLGQIASTLQQYTKRYHAGAFAIPLAGDLALAARAGLVHQWTDQGTVVAIEKCLAKTTQRRDFTGMRTPIPGGSRLLTHLAVDPGAQLPDLRAFDYIYAYLEDQATIAQLRVQGFRSQAVRISAASELVGLYARLPEYRYASYDEATLVELPCVVPMDLRRAILDELTQIHGWRDDYPYYHHGEWSQACLRGYQPLDPFWGVKPPEMSKTWKDAYPNLARLTTCDWTSLAERTPALRTLIDLVPWWSGFERIRLLRLTQGQLIRHTDITDRSAGTRNGQISRFHIPLITHPEIRTHAWDLTGHALSMHWQSWQLYYLDQRKPHAVTNPSTVARIHLVVDVITDAKVREEMAAHVA